MGSRVLWRRSATAVGLYTAVALGILGTVVAARAFSLAEFGLYATVLAATGFFQSLLDLTVEDSRRSTASVTSSPKTGPAAAALPPALS